MILRDRPASLHCLQSAFTNVFCAQGLCSVGTPIATFTGKEGGGHRATAPVQVCTWWFFGRIIRWWKWNQNWPVPSKWHIMNTTPKGRCFPVCAMDASLSVSYLSSHWILTKQVWALTVQTHPMSLPPQSWGTSLHQGHLTYKNSWLFSPSITGDLATSQGCSF